MNDNLPDIKEYKKYNYKLTPFKLCVLQNFPFIEADFDAITNYQLLCKVVEYLNHVIDNQNTVEDNFKIMADNLNTLYNFLDTLDLQDEVNNKLDVMAKDGTLASIINEEIFNNLNILIGSTNNPIHYGADPTGINDSTQAINQCIEANKGGVINFTPGIYKITNSILLPFKNNEKVSINGNGAKIITNDDIEYLFWVGYDRLNDEQNDVGFPSYIKNLFIDGSNNVINYGLFNVKGFKDLRIDNCTFYRVNNGILIGEETGLSADLLITNSLLYGNGSEYEGVGIKVNCNDSNVNEVRIYGFRNGYDINGYITIDNSHVLLRWKEQTSTNFNPYPVGSVIFNELYEQTNFANVNTACRINNCYADSVHKFLEIGDIGSHVILQGGFYYNARSGVNQHIIDCEGQAIKLNIINCQFSLSSGNNVSILRCTNSTNPYFSNYSQITISGIEIVGIANLTNYCDIALSGYTNQVHSNVTLNDEWKVIGFLANFQDYTRCDIDVFVNAWKYSIRIEDTIIDNNRVVKCMTYGGSTTNTNYTFGCIRDGNICYLCIKSSITTSVKIEKKLNSYNNLCFLSFPVYQDSLYNSDLTLSNFTNLTPVQVITLRQGLNIVSSQ